LPIADLLEVGSTEIGNWNLAIGNARRGAGVVELAALEML
jgi:hypothetical protein